LINLRIKYPRTRVTERAAPLIVQGSATISGVTAALAEVTGVLSVSGDDANAPTA
jgi:hypothetical protein